MYSEEDRRRVISMLESYRDGFYVTPEQLGQLLKLLEDGVITRASARIVFDELWARGKERAGRLCEHAASLGIGDCQS